MATLPPDWNAFIGLLIAKKVRYLVVGAHALAANGYPRATQALDLFVDRSKANVARLTTALSAFGFDDLARVCRAFEEPERMATLGNPPLRIDIMNHIDGVTFKTAWDGRLKAQFGDHLVSFLGARELRANKVASGRPKDLADVTSLDELVQVGRSQQRAAKKKARGRATAPSKKRGRARS